MAVKVVIPSLGLTMEEATIIEWIKREGTQVEKNEPILIIETDKATTEVGATESGILGAITAEAGDVIPVGHQVALIYRTDEYASASKSQPPAPESPGSENNEVSEAAGIPVKHNISESSQQLSNYLSSDHEMEPGRIKASPAAKKIAREQNVSLDNIPGTGPGGRILEHNVLQFIVQTSSKDVDTGRLESLTGKRKIIADRMMASSQSTAPVTLFASVRMDEIVSLRSQMNETLKLKQSAPISYDAIFAKAAALALQEHSAMQAQWSAEGLRFSEAIHIGFAVALTDGLVVPVIRETQNKSLFDIAREIAELVILAREGKLSTAQIKGGTFTITNLGMYPVKGFTPVINLPEAAILGIGGIQESAVVEKGAIIVGKITEISLTFDHRIVDGAPAAAFLTRIKSLLEQPYQLFM